MGHIGIHFFSEDKMDTKEASIQLMKDLYASETGLMPYTLYKRYGLKPIDLVQIVKKLQEKGYIRLLQDNRLVVTAEGRTKTEGYIASLGRQTQKKVNSAFFMSIKTHALDNRKPYIPTNFVFESLNKEGEENG